MKINKIVAKVAVPLSLVLAGASVSQAAVTITGNQGVCTSRAGSGHATTTLFFGKDIRNVIATNNEFQTVGGSFVGSDTNLTFDIWESQGSASGACIGNINVQITAGTNESAQFAVEDHLITPGMGQGVIVRTGIFDNRRKLDIYVDLRRATADDDDDDDDDDDEGAASRQVVWNNFVGLPNPSELMSAMRFISGQHLAIAYTGPIGTVADVNVQVFDNAGNFVGIASETIGANSVVITDVTRSLQYFDIGGNPVPESALPRDGEGYIKVLLDQEASFVILYKKAKPNFVSPNEKTWKNQDLATSTITFARRNAGNDPRGIGE